MESVYLVRFMFLATTLIAAVATAAQATPKYLRAPTTDAPGPLKTSTAEYRLPAAIDADVLENRPTEIWARVYWPQDTTMAATRIPTKKHPLLMFLHGNHGTCGSGTSPRNDSSCEYTNEGSCPEGYVVTPNHEGYNYAAEHLASWGYVVVSINANRGITCGSGDADDWGLVLARGRLILRHLQLWHEWTTTGGAPSTLGAPEQFVGAVDFANVGLMGHSRGGEGVRAALNLYRDTGSIWTQRIPGLDIRAIYEIGAVDGQSNRVLDAPSVAWNQTLPLCDGDVSDLQGRQPFERMMSRFSTQQEAESRPTPKSLTMVWGANHNYFNSEWQTSDAYACDGAPLHEQLFDETKPVSAAQQSIALQSMSAFFRANVGDERTGTLGQHFDPAYVFPSVFSQIGPVDRDFIPGFELSKVLLVDDFTAQTGLNASGTQNFVSNVQVHHENANPPIASVAWQNGAADRFYQTNFADVGEGSDVSSFDFLDFRAGRAMNDSSVELKSSVDFSVRLVASDDSLSNAVSIADYSLLLGPPNDSAALTQTVRIPVGAFGKFDLTKIRGVRFVFDKTSQGVVRLAHVRFGVASDKITTTAVGPISTIADLNATAAKMNTPPKKTMDSKPAATTPPEKILPADPRLFSSKTTNRASWMKPRKVSASRQLPVGRSGLELYVTTTSGFPVMDSLPVLNIENHLFYVSRYPSSGKTHTLIFTISDEAFAKLPNSGRAQVQYGLKKPSRIWTLPNFSKTETQEELEE